MNSLTTLPDISFTDKDPELILSEIISRYEKTAQVTLYQGDPVRLFLEAIAYIIAHQRSLIDYAAKQNLLAYATGYYLEHLGILLGVDRLKAAAATTTLRFKLSAPLDFPVLIPAGTRASDGGNGLMFASVEDVLIYSGDTYADVQAFCTETGEAGNGMIAGQIKYLVDPVPYIAGVENRSATTGGADEESDESLRERVQMAPESFSVAGASGAYEYWARTAHQDIIDVAVIGPEDEPGNVYVYPLMADGKLPSQEILNLIDGVLNDEKVRPLSDHVFVQAPDEINYHTELIYYIAHKSATSAASIQKAVAAAVADFELWQKSKLGRDINPSELIRMVMSAGALRVEVTQPQHTVLTGSQVAIADSEATVTFGGLEDG